jgi:beta-lactamase class A
MQTGFANADGKSSATHMLTTDFLARAAHDAGLEPSTTIVKAFDGSIDIALRPEQTYYPASMIKTPLAVAAYDRVAIGELALADRFEVTQANVTPNSLSSPLVPGYHATVTELIELMITISDNVATNMFFDILGRERATETIREKYGLADTTFHRKLSGSDPLIVDPGWIPSKGRNTHPPADAVRVFEMIAQDRVPFAAALLATLGRQQHNAKLSPGLREGDRFFHKGGETDEVSHDGGILETAEGKRYVVVVYTGLQGSKDKNRFFKPFMTAIRSYL